MADSVYWTNYADNAIRGAARGGGAVETLYELAQGAVAPTGIAIYAAAGRVDRANYGGGAIRAAPLAGGLVDTLYGPGPVVTVPGWGGDRSRGRSDLLGQRGRRHHPGRRARRRRRSTE